MTTPTASNTAASPATPLSSSAGGSVSPAASVSSTGLTPGAMLDKFEIVSQIGSGGMSVVWKGYDRLLDRPVAIKQIMPELTAENEQEVREQFRKEAAIQKQAAGSHPQLVQVIDFVDEPRGMFIIMEYVDGVGLDQLMQQADGPLPVNQALGILGAAAMALDAIHQQGVIHRDLKPSNILLPRAGGLKVCDFGLAGFMNEQNAMTAGTVRYMAPELFRGQSIDARADIYALGMIAYELFAGREKFEQAFKIVLRDQRNQALRWMKWHTNERVSAPPLSELNAEVPAGVSDLVSRMMDKDLQRRVPTAQDVIGAIRRSVANPQGQQAQIDPEQAEQAARMAAASSEKTTKLPTKSRLPMILGLILLSQLVLLGGGFGLKAYLDAQKDWRAQQAVRAEALGELREGVELAKDEQWAQAKAVFDKLAKQWPNDPVLGKPNRAKSLFCAGQLAMDEEQYDQARELFKQADEAGFANRDRVQTLIDECENRGAFVAEVARIDEAIEQGSYAVASNLVVTLRKSSATLLEYELSRLDEIGARIEDLKNRALIDHELQKATRLAESGQQAQAIAVLEDATRRYPSSRELRELLSQYKGAAHYEATLAAAQQAESAGDLPKAVSLYKQVVALKPDARIDDRIKRLQSRHMAQEGFRLEEAGRLDAAAQAYSDALSFYENDRAREGLGRIKNVDRMASYISSGDAAFAAGNFSTALQHYKKAVSLGAGAAVEQKMNDVLVKQGVQDAQALMRQGKFDDAKAALADVQQRDPGNQPAQQILADITRWEKYLSLRNEGDKFREASNFSFAIRKYRDAREVIGTKEIDQRLKDTEYDSLMAQARDEIGQADWRSAHSLLKTAQRVNDTEEVRKLIVEAEGKLPKDPDAF